MIILITTVAIKVLHDRHFEHMEMKNLEIWLPMIQTPTIIVIITTWIQNAGYSTAWLGIQVGNRDDGIGFGGFNEVAWQ